MSILEEMEFEDVEPTCSCCGALLTFDEWELNGDICNSCCEAAEYESIYYED